MIALKRFPENYFKMFIFKKKKKNVYFLAPLQQKLKLGFSSTTNKESKGSSEQAREET